MKLALVALTSAGRRIGRRLAEAEGSKTALPGGSELQRQLYLPASFTEEKGYERTFAGRLADLLAEIFPLYDGFILIMATGIAVRVIAPLIKDKRIDPAVVVLDEGATFSISLLSGHLGGANALARWVAAVTGAWPVVTTASDVRGLLALDAYAQERGLLLEPWENLKPVTRAMLEGKPVRIYTEVALGMSLSPNVQVIPIAPAEAVSETEAIRGAPARSEEKIGVTFRIPEQEPYLILRRRQRRLSVGLGCRRGVTRQEVLAAIKQALDQVKGSLTDVIGLATIDRKKDETGLLEASRELGIKIRFFPAAELSRLESSSASAFVREKVGVGAVAEPAALLGGSQTRLILPKQVLGRVTVAVAEESEETTQRESEAIKEARERRPAAEKGSSQADYTHAPGAAGASGAMGQIQVVGLGPGALLDMTRRAEDALRQADVVIGYRPYLERVRGILPGRRLLASGMRQEVERAQEAIAEARRGRRVVVVSSGDPGVYGMAGLILELAAGTSLPIEIIPGVTAATAAAASLGAPLMNDFAVISLSDLLTPWEIIQRRLEAAAASDFVLVLYNPRSHTRTSPLEEAQRIIRRYRPGSTPAGVVKKASQIEEERFLTDLDHLLEAEVDMSTTVIVGNSQTKVQVGFLITPRGYKF
ncbi:MAG: precorrin-3B C(17)-methyltransferase [Firmicutes bacterium]|nr:precorrin-3B C(17)-methyltransferase [Bacillota bacterium]